MIKRLLAIFCTLLAAVLFIFPAQRWGMTPAIGMLVSPFEGAWRSAEPSNSEAVPEISRIAGLRSDVQVWFDSSMVPHIAAKNLEDLYFTQGYVAARLRLWQMDFISRVASGRISEVVGKRALEFDKFQRRIGLVYGAQNSLDSMMRNPISKLMLEQFSQGVNAYIMNTDSRLYPVEYKVLGYAPEPWTPLKTALVVKYLSYTLTVGTQDLQMTKLRNGLSAEDLNDLFPGYPSIESPVIPADPAWKTYAMPQGAVVQNAPKKQEVLTSPTFEKEDGIGSNNWVVSKDRSAPGRGPFLSNDPHLQLSAPCIWVQMHLSSPGMDVEGVTVPGIPGIIIGFNRDLAWGVTNVDADVLDFFKTTVTKDGSKYLYTSASGLKQATMKVEELMVRDSGLVHDTVFYAGNMPIVYGPKQKPFRDNFPAGYAMRWTAHEASNEILAFYKINSAKNYGNYLAALRLLSNPAQNVAYADRQGNTALWVNGRFPIKTLEQGKFLFNEIDSRAEWKLQIPQMAKPHAFNHPQGYLASANQSSTDSTYPYYLNWEFAVPSRAIRINEKLSHMRNANQDSMGALQGDNLGVMARRCLPQMLDGLDMSGISEPGKEVAKMLQDWKFQYDSADIAPSFYEQWFRSFADTLWDELKPFGNKLPSPDRTAQILEGVGNMKWVDVMATPTHESIQKLLTIAFNKAMADMTHSYGAAGKNWHWGRVKHTEMNHMAQIPGMGFGFVSASGGRGIVNATGPSAGPSWRMVVECGEKVRAWGIIPGGQSGNPGSIFYNDQLEEWRTNRLRSINFAPAEGGGNGKAIQIIRLMPD